MRFLIVIEILFLTIFLVTSAQAAIKTQTVEYTDANTVLEGFLAYDDSIKTKMPAILIVHEWTGIGPYIKKRTQQIAVLGYAAFAIDIYGKGVRPTNTDDAAKQAAIYRNDRVLMCRRATTGLEQVKKFPFVDTSRIAVMGYCFGGGVAIELARNGADLKGAVSFHGNLDTPNTNDAKNIKAKILVFHGADDPHITMDQVNAFINEMRNANKEWQLNIYGKAVHSFTNPDSGNNPSKGVAYNKEADQRSWESMTYFYKEIFSLSNN